MKLRTEMEGVCVHARSICVDEYDVLPEQAEDLQYDAAAAHALMQAMGELEAHHRGWHHEIRARADEIMREWGYAD